ncbi:hypothetical protein [Ideonella sp. YS5]|uniref:hypothetical protein n=1 Tax=Ideonella sp. YS5 TaxID=3453714 RepID=UPI003EF073BC
MSQHYFSTHHQGEPVTVLLGWDRPVGHFFLVVERDDPGPDEDDYLYLNLDEPDAFDLPLEFFRQKLKDLGIEVPAQMFEQVQLDTDFGIGNRRVIYQPDGRFESAETA